MSVAPVTETTFVPITDRVAEECPRFRILVVGRCGTGKVSLVKAIFGTSFADVARGQAGTIPINQEIISQDNKRLAIHYSNDYEGSMDKFDTMKKCIVERSQKSLAQRLHAIWLCITTPSSTGPKLALDERIFKLSQNKVPIIVVFTKFDDFMSGLGEGVASSQELAEREFNEKYGCSFETSTNKGLVPYTVVATSQPETLRRLVEITMRNILVNNSKPIFTRIKRRLSVRGNHPSRLDAKLPSSAQIILAAAQRVDTAIKIATSIKVGSKMPDVHFSNVDLQKCLCAIHKDLVTIWNIQDLDDLLLNDPFRRRMIVLVDDIKPDNKKTTGTTWVKPRITMLSNINGQTNDVHYGMLEHIRCLMGYVVDLTIILQAVFQVSFQNQSEMKVTPSRVSEIVYEFVCSKKKDVHNAIATFVGDKHIPTSNDMVDKIESLIKENEMKGSDLQFDRTRPPLPSLLAILRIEEAAQNAVNQATLDLMTQLLNSPNYHTIASELSVASDVELLLDFILCLLRDGSLMNCSVPDASQKARRLMDKLSRRDVLPKSLFIADVKTDLAAIGMGGFGTVFKGEYGGRFVALKVLYRASHAEDSLRRVFCSEALAWRSLSHRYILPLLGIYEEEAWLFLVSPLTENKTLAEWRRNQKPDLVEIHRLIREVAEGIQYIHSEGIVHGCLHGGHVLLDSDFHCQISGLESAQHIDATSPSTPFLVVNFAAPELIGICNECGGSGCNECHEDHDTLNTKETDVYAFGCLYYSIFFDTVPFRGKNDFQVVRSVINGVRPDRLNSPKIDNDAWQLIELCWKHNASERPTMQNIIEHMSATALWSPASETATSSSGVFPALLASLNESTTRSSSTINKVTLDLACKLLDLPEDTIATSELSIADIELLLDFLLHLLRDNSTLSFLGVQDANRKARRLTFKLTSMMITIPKFLYITNIKTEAHLDMIGTGGFGRVYRARYQGQQVALKVVDKCRHDGSLSKEFLREAIAWRSLSHRFILPFLGIYKEKSHLSLVSAFMENGTLTQWRRERERSLTEIHRMMLEVAEGIQYLHSEGIVHGDLHGGNVLLDSTFHCQITDFGSTRYAETTVTQSTTAVSVHFAAPELFGMCTKCYLPDCDGCHEGDREEHRSKTKETDVYAFGCLYYAIFFNNVPFHGNNNLQVLRLVTKGKRPKRLENPRMEDSVWDLIQSCMETIPSQRPTMEYVLMRVTSFVEAASISLVKQLCTR